MLNRSSDRLAGSAPAFRVAPNTPSSFLLALTVGMLVYISPNERTRAEARTSVSEHGSTPGFIFTV